MKNVGRKDMLNVIRPIVQKDGGFCTVMGKIPSVFSTLIGHG